MTAPRPRPPRRTVRPIESFDVGLQHERTSLAWERTAISLMVAATLLARYAAADGLWVVAGVALALAGGGGGLLVWSGVHYDELHEPLCSGGEVDHHGLIKVVASAATGVVAMGLALSVWRVLWG